MRTLRDVINQPLSNPYSIDILARNVGEARLLATKLRQLPTVSKVLTIESFGAETSFPSQSSPPSSSTLSFLLISNLPFPRARQIVIAAGRKVVVQKNAISIPVPAISPSWPRR